MRSSRMGYKAAKTLEKTPATIDSQVTRTLERRVAKRSWRVSIRAEESVEMEILSLLRMKENISDSGVTPMRASW